MRIATITTSAACPHGNKKRQRRRSSQSPNPIMHSHPIQDEPPLLEFEERLNELDGCWAYVETRQDALDKRIQDATSDIREYQRQLMRDSLQFFNLIIGLLDKAQIYHLRDKTRELRQDPKNVAGCGILAKQLFFTIESEWKEHAERDSPYLDGCYFSKKKHELDASVDLTDEDFGIIDPFSAMSIAEDEDEPTTSSARPPAKKMRAKKTKRMEMN